MKMGGQFAVCYFLHINSSIQYICINTRLRLGCGCSTCANVIRYCVQGLFSELSPFASSLRELVCTIRASRVPRSAHEGTCTVLVEPYSGIRVVSTTVARTTVLCTYHMHDRPTKVQSTDRMADNTRMTSTE